MAQLIILKKIYKLKMLLSNICVNGRIVPLLKGAFDQGKVVYGYLKQKDLDEIKGKYLSKSLTDHIKIGLLVVKALCIQGFKDAKADVRTWNALRAKSLTDRTHQQQLKYQQITRDIIKAVPAFTVFNVPFGGPLFFIYLQLFPNFTPTWLLLEHIYNAMLSQEQENRVAAYHHFKRKFSIHDPMQLPKLVAEQYKRMTAGGSTLSNQDMRAISNLLMGTYRDGTYWLTHYSPLKRMNLRIEYLLFPGLSRQLMRWKIQSLVRKYPYYRVELEQRRQCWERLEFCLEKEMTEVDFEAYV